jgi:CBS domain containing-hemolysin-like protein
MESDSPLPAIALAISLVLFSLASIAEAAISSVRRDRVQFLSTEGGPGAAALQTLQHLPLGPAGSLTLVRAVCFSSGLVSTIAIVIVDMGIRWFPVALAALAVIVFMGLIDTGAKRLASLYGERVATGAAGPVRLLSWLLNPILTGQAVFARLSPGLNGDKSDSGQELVPTEINLPLDSAGEPLDDREVRMILGVVRQDKTIAREIMVPRVDVVAVEIRTTIAELAEKMVAGGHSRIPVYKGDLDHVAGIAYARDILQRLTHDGDPERALAESVVRPALFTPESKTLEELLNEFQEKRVQMAMVVDEYGGVSGLVTIEDLLEEIVGEIQDEFDIGGPDVEPVSDNEYLMDARVGIEQIRELLNVSIEGDGFDTLGGFVYQRLGKIPSQGDIVEYDGLKIQVVSTVGRRLKRLRVTTMLGDAFRSNGK